MLKMAIIINMNGKKTMEADLWGWFFKEHRTASPIKHQMIEHYDKGWDAMRAERGDEAVGEFTMGLEIAKKLEEPCWQLFFEYWRAEAYHFCVEDYRKALNDIVQAAAHAHKPQYLNCAVRGRVYYTLVQIYYDIDCSGYEDKIRETLKFLKDQVPLDLDTIRRMQYLKAGIAYHQEDYDTAEREAWQYMEMSSDSSHRQSDGYAILSMIEYARGNLKKSLEHCYLSEAKSIDADLQLAIIDNRLQMAVIHCYLGNKQVASNHYQQAITHQQRLGAKPQFDYYNLICEYHELTDNPAEALAQRQASLQAMIESSGPDHIVKTHLNYCRLLGRLGHDMTDAFQEAKKAADLLIKPAWYLAKLKQIEHGNYYQYEWQKNHAAR